MQEQLRKQKEDAAQQKLEVEAACKDLFPTAVLVGFQSLGLGLAHHGCKVRKTVWNPGTLTLLMLGWEWMQTCLN
jgi:hypothetical protein